MVVTLLLLRSVTVVTRVLSPDNATTVQISFFLFLLPLKNDKVNSLRPESKTVCLRKG